MHVSIVTFANLGKKQNLKTPDILPAIDTLTKANALEQIICQIRKDFYVTQTTEAVPRFVRYLLRAPEKVFHFSFPRWFTENVFDFFAAQQIRPVNVVLFHPGYFMQRSVRKAKKNGSIVIDMAVSAHIRKNAELEREEMKLLGFPSYEGLYMHLDTTRAQTAEFDYVVAMSDFVKDSYVQNGFPAENICVATPDIDTERFSPRIQSSDTDDTFRVLYVAHTQPLKGLHYLLQAWKDLELPDAKLVIAGGFTDMPEELRKRYLTEISDDSRITWIQNAYRPEDLYRSASVLVFPTLTEGFGRVTLEAMACGIPVITTVNARGIVEEGKTGFVVPIRDANAIREKLQYLYNNREVVREMGYVARNAVEQKRSFGETVYEICENIVEKKHV